MVPACVVESASPRPVPDSPPALFFGLAVRADTVELELVAHELEAQPCGHVVLQVLDGVVFELDDLLALDAVEMVVVLVCSLSRSSSC